MIITSRVKQTAVGIAACLCTSSATAQLVTQGLSPASNTYRSFSDASIVRDSELNQPLDLLNDFYPAIEVVATSDDNIRRRSDISEEDIRIAVLPSLAYRTNLGRHQFYAAYTGIFTYHDDFETEDSESNVINAQLGLDLSRRWDLNIFAGKGDSFVERGVSGSRPFNQFVPDFDRGPDQVDFSFYGADLIYGRKTGRLGAAIGFERYTTSFENNFQGDVNPTGGRDRDMDSVHFDISYQIGSKTTLFGRIDKTDVDYDRRVNSLDSEVTTYLVGVRLQATNALSGVVGIGSTDKDFLDPSREDYDSSATYYANLQYAINPFSTLSLNASRAIEEPGDANADFYESDMLGVAWNHAITPQLEFNAYAKWLNDGYNSGREDEFFDFGLGLDYAWRPWLTAGVFYGEIERESTLSGAEYESSFWGVRLRSDLRPLLKGRRSDEEPDRSFNYPRPTNR